MYKIQTLNSISHVGLNQFSKKDYELSDSIDEPDAILLRSYDMHGMKIPASLKVVGRAGAGVNNIPVDILTQLGIPVFNTPGANANAVKELVITGMLLASRHICQGWDYTRQLRGDDKAIAEQVEKAKKQFVGYELAGKRLGVIGLGAIGVKVANAALALDMDVIGYDPAITVQRAWELSALVEQATSISDVFKESDFLTVHVPLTDETRNMIDAETLSRVKNGIVILNFAREGIVNEGDLLRALDKGDVAYYVTDFPSRHFITHEKVLALPHLGASTREAEENCAVMVAKQIQDYLEHGNIHRSVNFPEVIMPRTEGYRIAIVNDNVPNMVAQISSILGKANLNIVDLLNKSRGSIAYTLIDVDQAISNDVADRIRSIKGILGIRLL